MTLCHSCYENAWAVKFPHRYDELLKKEGNIYIDNFIHPETPKAFLNTNMEHNDFMRKVSKWEQGKDKCGVVLHGQTGIGKSRAAWWLFNLYFVYNHTDCLFLQMRKFEGMIEKGFDEKKHSKILDTMINCSVLVLDDLGKERLTARMETDLFAVIDERTSQLRTTIITTNYTGETLLDRFNNKETGTAIIRRLRDYMDVIGG
jgi:DNA replication protein DnaC